MAKSSKSSNNATRLPQAIVRRPVSLADLVTCMNLLQMRVHSFLFCVSETYSRAVLMLVDALRWDMVVSGNMPYLQTILRKVQAPDAKGLLARTILKH